MYRTPQQATTTRRVHLPLVGVERSISLPVPVGEGSLTQVLPALRRLSDEVMKISEQRRAQDGRKVSCRTGCAHCCRHLVPISLVEARALVSAFEKLPPAIRKQVRTRFDEAITRMEAEGLLPATEPPRAQLVSRTSGESAVTWADVNKRYFELQIACPFLQHERCVVYDARPMSCREYRVTSDPEHCRTLDEQVDPVPRPFYATRALSSAHEELSGARPAAIALPMLLEWADADAIELDEDLAGIEALEAVLLAIEWDAEDLDGRPEP